jgi:hypothetical protein
LTVTDARPVTAPGGRRLARIAAALDAERARQAGQPKLSPWDPRAADFLAAWVLETELAAARAADAADWARAAEAAIVRPRRRVPYVRSDGRTDHPGGPVPVW